MIKKTKKIVYNECYGGFSLSDFGERKYVERALNCESSEIDDIVKSFKFPCWYNHNTRKDPILISILEDFGSEKISGDFSNLVIIEIDQDDQWIISEYDGFEEVITKKMDIWND